MARIVADVYVDGGRNIRVLTTPGRSVQFTGGHAFIVDDRDMPHMLQMAGARVHPRPESMPWASEWLSRTLEIKAVVSWPEGWKVRFRNKDVFVIKEPKPEAGVELATVGTATPTVSQPVNTVDLTARPKWIKPEDLLKEPPDDSGTGDSGNPEPGAGTPESDSEPAKPTEPGPSRGSAPQVRSRHTQRARAGKAPKP